MPTFTKGYTEPGVYTKVILEANPTNVSPAFVTALIGRTSLDKPAVTTLIRNRVESFHFPIVDNEVDVPNIVADADETRRRDYLGDDTQVQLISSVPTINSVIDVQGNSYLYGASFDWVPFVTGIKTYIEWAARYQMELKAGTTVLVAGQNGSGLPVQMARVSQDTGFSGITAVSMADTVATPYVIKLIKTATDIGNVTWDGGVAVPFTGVSFTAGIFEAELTGGTPGGAKIRVQIHQTLFNALSDDTYENNVYVSTRGPQPIGTVGNGTTAADGVLYDVRYQGLKNAADLDPKRFDDLTNLQLWHGQLAKTTPTDSLSLGAAPYFKQGGGTVVTVSLRDVLIDSTNGFDLTDPGQYEAAYEDALERLEDVPDVSLVIVLTPVEVGYRTSIMNNVKSHVLNMSSVTERKPRMAIMGARANTVDETVFSNAAQAMNSNRIIYLAPATAVITTGGFTYTMDGSAIASAIAGICSSPDIDAGSPLTRKSIDAFDDIPDPFTRTQKNRMAGAYGVCIIEKVGSLIRIRHFLSTYPATILGAEGKVVRIEIDIRRSLQNTLDPIIIGTRLLDGATLSVVEAYVAAVLRQKVNDQVLVKYRIDKVAMNGTDKRQIDVQVSVLPVLDVDWVYIEATFKTEL